MKSLSVRVVVATLLACGLIAACASPAVAQDAAATYKSKCAMCHGPDGKGGKMGTRDFASAEVKAESDAQLADIISKGKGKMPPYTIPLILKKRRVRACPREQYGIFLRLELPSPCF